MRLIRRKNDVISSKMSPKEYRTISQSNPLRNRIYTAVPDRNLRRVYELRGACVPSNLSISTKAGLLTIFHILVYILLLSECFEEISAFTVRVLSDKDTRTIAKACSLLGLSIYRFAWGCPKHFAQLL